MLWKQKNVFFNCSFRVPIREWGILNVRINRNIPNTYQKYLGSMSIAQIATLIYEKNMPQSLKKGSICWLFWHCDFEAQSLSLVQSFCWYSFNNYGIFHNFLEIFCDLTVTWKLANLEHFGKEIQIKSLPKYGLNLNIAK